MKKIVKTLLSFAASLIFLSTFSTPYAKTVETNKASETIETDEVIEYDDLYGKETGHIHAFLSSTISTTDNINNSQDDQLSDTLTILSTGIGFVFPAIQDRLTPENAAGDFLTGDSSYRYQSGLLYSMTINQYSEYPINDSENQQLQAFLRYHFRGGLSVELLGQGIQASNYSNLNETIEQDKSSTIANRASLSYIISQRTKLDLEYSSLDVNYEADRNTFRNHQEIGYSTSFFLPFPRQSSYFLDMKMLVSNTTKKVQITQCKMILLVDWTGPFQKGHKLI